ncbi:hypothetical protein FRC12_014879, partial [Ceratobasidium sp. 428]
EYKIRTKASGPQPQARDVTQPLTSKRRKHAAKRELRFDGETDSDEPNEPQPKKARYSSSEAHSPPPKAPGHGPSAAGGRESRECGVVVKPKTAREVRDLFGIDLATATASSLKDAVHTLSNSDPLQVGSARRYPQVGGETPGAVSTLKRKGGYYRDVMNGLSQPTSYNKEKRSALQDDTRPAKSLRRESRGEVVDHEQVVDATSPRPPPLPSFLVSPQRPSATGLANSSRSRSDIRAALTGSTAKYRPTPIPEPNDRYAQSAPENYRARDVSSTPRPQSPASVPYVSIADKNPRPSGPDPWPATLAPDPTSPQPATSWCSAWPSTSHHTPPADPNTATEEQTESELTLKPKLKKDKKKRKHLKKKRPRPTSPAADATLSDDQNSNAQQDAPWDLPPNVPRNNPTRQPPPNPQPRHEVLRQRRTESFALMRQMVDVLFRGDAQAPADLEAMLERAGKMTDGWHEEDGTTPEPRPRDSTSPAASPQASTSRPSASRPSASRPSTSHTSLSHPQSGSIPCRAPRSAHQDQSLDDDGDQSDDEDESDVNTDDEDPVDRSWSGLGRYPGTRGKVASRAIPILLVTATLKGVYPDADTAFKWARNAYRRAWKVYCPHIPYKECPYDLLLTISIRISHLHTDVKKRIRDLIAYLFGFKHGTSERTRLANQELVRQLGHNTFHCRPGKKQYEHKVFKQAICAAFFWYPRSFLLRNPSILEKLERKGLPLPAVSFVLTMMQESIEEWDSGQHRLRDLHVDTQRARFDAHLQGLINYRATAAGRLTKFQRKWFRRGLKHANIQINRGDDGGKFCQSITHPKDVQPDSQNSSHSEADSDTDTDSEPEPKYDGNGRFTAKSKGKHKSRK